jgi:hypothetical protein
MITRACAAALRVSLVSLVSLANLVIAPAREARADALSCASTAENAQSLRQKKKLVEARRELVACGSVKCPMFVRADCLRWLDEVQATLPTVVVRANDASGSDVLEGSVLVDGAAGGALGSAIPLDPGPHVLGVKRGEEQGELRVLVAEGEKNRVLVVKLAPRGAPTAAISGTPDGRANPPGAPAESPPPPAGRGPSPWIAGGIGAAGLVAFGVLQVIAQDEYDGLKERCAPRCEGGEVDPVRTKVTLSAVALGVGVLGVGTGLALWFALAPDDAPSSSAPASAIMSRSRARRGLSVGALPTPGGAAGAVRVRF